MPGADREWRRGGLITIYNFKGGPGKTSCAMNIALTMDYGVVTNDIYSPIEEVFDNVLKVSPSEEFPDFPTDAEVIFDLGATSKLAASPCYATQKLYLFLLLTNI